MFVCLLVMLLHFHRNSCFQRTTRCVCDTHYQHVGICIYQVLYFIDNACNFCSRTSCSIFPCMHPQCVHGCPTSAAINMFFLHTAIEPSTDNILRKLYGTHMIPRFDCTSRIHEKRKSVLYECLMFRKTVKTNVFS